MDKIIDIHTHILPGVDDGSKDISESIDIINYLNKSGISDIVLTSHYIKNTKYCYNELTRKNILDTLRKKLNNDSINLYLGNEVYLNEEVVKQLKEKEISTINNTKYMLVELPLTGYLYNFQDILCSLNDNGIIPIIAHPERYEFIQKDNSRVKELLEFNCLLQCNIDSIIGKYGKKAKKAFKWLLKNNLVSFVATDTHYVSDNKKLDKAYKKLKKIVGKDKFTKLTYDNPLSILSNKDIEGNLEYLIKEENKKK